ncbi:MAG: ATP-binding protein [Marinilabiliaceae bacterium]|jgi:nitrogen fixation/metabolism regulation signal transduction histidine kinase|nr:ATP-binding protein [Marinilabiliaceae bacterium]
MRSQRIDLPVLLQVVLLACTPVLFAMTLRNDVFVVTRIGLCVIWCAQIIFFYRYIKRSENRLRQAVRIISSGEEYQVFGKKGLSKVHEDVLDEINTAISIFSDLKIEKETNLLFFQEVMENVPAGIVVMNASEKFDFVNKAAFQLLGIDSNFSLSDTEKLRPGLSFWLREIKGEHNLIDINFSGKSLRLSVSAREIKVRGDSLKIFSLKDIKKEVDTKETETWHNMLRILSHEVVNSVSPITLSANSMKRNLAELKEIIIDNDKSESILADIDEGLSAISERGKGLNEFVESMREITKIPDPVPGTISLSKLISESVDIMRMNLQDNLIRLEEDIDDASLLADRRLINHVLINLVKNSMESFSDQVDKVICIRGRKKEESIIIQVEDNGPGIPAELQSQIFSPFFSTKPEGSGLGLSFSRRVVEMHKGDISFWSEPGRTIFTLTLPAAHKISEA